MHSAHPYYETCGHTFYQEEIRKIHNSYINTIIIIIRANAQYNYKQACSNN